MAIDVGASWLTANRFEAEAQTGSNFEAARTSLYNGNINSMVTTITDPSSRAILPQGMVYHYDQLNRLLEAKAYNNDGAANLKVPANVWDIIGGYTPKYLNTFAYDANGNILKQKRQDETATDIDSLSYKYNRDGLGNILRNQLLLVRDNVSNPSFGDDIDDQVTGNYKYDAEGRLAKDLQEGIDTIIWTVTGKVKEVLRTGGSSKKNLKFDYDAMGMRVAKHIFNSSNTWEKSTYYVRDPQGNVMATYEKTVVGIATSYKVKERDIYGSSRLGMNTEEVEMIGASVSTTNATHIIGVKYFEMINHLGNVLSVVSDKPLPIDWDVDGTVDCYKAEIISASDYYPFGAPMVGRQFSSSSYRYGFNGKEKQDELHVNSGDAYDFDVRMHDARLGRFLSVDPHARQYTSWSPYQFAHDNPILSPDDGYGPPPKAGPPASGCSKFEKGENTSSGTATPKPNQAGFVSATKLNIATSTTPAATTTTTAPAASTQPASTTSNSTTTAVASGAMVLSMELYTAAGVQEAAPTGVTQVTGVVTAVVATGILIYAIATSDDIIVPVTEPLYYGNKTANPWGLTLPPPLTTSIEQPSIPPTPPPNGDDGNYPGNMPNWAKWALGGLGAAALVKDHLEANDSPPNNSPLTPPAPPAASPVPR
ncbi:hypothetical protein BH11BAC7_BH11BAC7_31860 [soil metagenome]